MNFHTADLATTDESPYTTGVRMSAGTSRIVSSFEPLDIPSNGNGAFHSPNRESFKAALYATFRGVAEGVLTPYLFYDPPSVENSITSDPWGVQKDIPLGAKAWDSHVAKSACASGQKAKGYDFTRSDVAILQCALNNGLVSRLPRNVSLYSYGPGDLIAVSEKDCLLTDAIIKSRAMVQSYNAVDINDRYAHEATQHVHRKFNIKAQAIQGDFMEGDLGLGNKNGTSVIMVFGGPFANAPIIPGRRTAKQKAAEYLSRLTHQHGMGTQIVMTVDTEDNPEKLLEHYKRTKSFEAFVLSSFPRAVHEGIVKTPYNVFDHWRMVTEYDPEAKAVKLIAECKKDHTLYVEDGEFKFKQGHRMVNIVSNKWDKNDIKQILRAAGFRDEKIYEMRGSSQKLITARSLNEPDLKLVS